ncbi:MAG: hypothetical protein KDA75_17195, partial [Planctomycetaceae bacterium]|nr:hypothetical protein [Planctomycetaceae bacterium]
YSEPAMATAEQSDRCSRDQSVRLLIVAMTLVQPLAACPTPGTQLAIGTLPALLAMLIVAGDLFRWMEFRRSESIGLLRTSLRGLVALALVTLVARDIELFRRWDRAEPLRLAGATYLRLPAEQARARQIAVGHLREHADLFMASPTGCCSLYLWSELSPPTSHNVTFWEALLPEARQLEIIAALEAARRPMLVRDLTQAPVVHQGAPLHRYLEARFNRREVTGLLEVWSADDSLAMAQVEPGTP